MFEPNVTRVLDLIGPSDLVLDIGGWARPFNRADYVIDAEPYATRGYCGTAQGGERERFTNDTWIQRDICDHRPFPFGDKRFDFVICSHTLEDVRDPVWVCAEMIRVAKGGYIEVPSRVAESSRGVEPGQVGWSHHRWLIDIDDSSVTFLMKYHMIHSRMRFSMPASYLRNLPEHKTVQWLFWIDRFAYRERTIHGVDRIAGELDGFVRRVHPYSRWRLRSEAVWYASKVFVGRVLQKVRVVLRNG
jgi:SAM-dependent methyltransferase